MDSKTSRQRVFNVMAAVPPLLVLALGAVILSRASAQDTPGTPVAAKNSAAINDSTNQGPTYLRDVQPILMGNCSRCHNQESRFVYNWLDYKTAYADRWELKRRVWDSWTGIYYKESMPIANSPESLSITEEQRAIIKHWVRDGAPLGTAPVSTGAKTKDERIQLGSHLFASICAACHQPTGLGRPNVFPPLAGSDYLNADKSRAIGIVIHGRQGELVVNGQKFNNSMPPFPLTDDDIANVLTYVYNSFGNSGLEVTPDEVKAVRAQPYTPAAATPAPPANNQFQ